MNNGPTSWDDVITIGQQLSEDGGIILYSSRWSDSGLSTVFPIGFICRRAGGITLYSINTNECREYIEKQKQWDSIKNYGGV